MNSLRFVSLFLVLMILTGNPANPQGIERWLFIPNGENPRIDKEPIIRQPNGNYDLKFLYQGQPSTIRRFGRSIAQDYPLILVASDTGAKVPSISEVAHLLETLSQAAAEAEIDRAQEMASEASFASGTPLTEASFASGTPQPEASPVSGPFSAGISALASANPDLGPISDHP